MSIIVPSPDCKAPFSGPEKLHELLPRLVTPEFQKLLREANDRYLYWDRFRYQPMPHGIAAKDAWAYLKMMRFANSKAAPLLTDKNGTPFSYWVPDSMLKSLHTIDLRSGVTILTDQPGAMPSREQYIISSLMEESIASSQLEGADTTRRIAKQMLRSGRRPTNKSEQMIMNNWQTMQYVREKRGEKLTPELILQIHSIVTADTIPPEEAGQLRTGDDIHVMYNNEVVHVPPPAKTLPERLKHLCVLANQNNEENWIHPVIKGAMIHFGLAYDHPFTDGNGRTARALLYWYMLSRGYSLFEYLAISKYFLRAPGQYVRSYMYTESDDNDLTYFLAYNLRAIRLALNDLRTYLVVKQREIARSNELLKTYRGLNPRQKTILYHAIRHPEAIYTIEEHKNYHGVVYQTARTDLLSLATKGFLKKEKEGHEYVFMPAGRMLDKLRIANQVKTG